MISKYINSLLLLFIVGLISSCQEEVIPEQDFSSFGELVTIARSGDGTEVRALTAKDNRGENLIIFNIPNRKLDETYKFNVYLTKTRREFIRFTYVSVYSDVNYIASYLGDEDIRAINENLLDEIIVEYYDKENNWRGVIKYIVYSENKLKEVISNL